MVIASQHFNINMKVCIAYSYYSFKILIIKFDRGWENRPHVSICASSWQSKSSSALDSRLNENRIEGMSLVVLHLTKRSMLMNGINIFLFSLITTLAVFFFLNKFV